MTPEQKRPPSKREIEVAKTPNGGWTKSQIAKWGVSWPPPKGWKNELRRKRAEWLKNGGHKQHENRSVE